MEKAACVVHFLWDFHEGLTLTISTISDSEWRLVKKKGGQGRRWCWRGERFKCMVTFCSFACSVRC